MMLAEVEPAHASAMFIKYENRIISSWIVTNDGKYTAITPFYGLDSSNLVDILNKLSANEHVIITFYGVCDGNFIYEDREPVDIVHLGNLYSGLDGQSFENKDNAIAQYELTGIIERIEVVKDLVIFFIRTKWAEDILIPIFHSNENSGCKVGDKVSCSVLFRVVGIERVGKDMSRKIGSEDTSRYGDEFAKLIKGSKSRVYRKKSRATKKGDKKGGKKIQKTQKRKKRVEKMQKDKFDRISEEEKILSAKTVFCKKEQKKEVKENVHDYI
ncbi:MAG: hypothetical protein QXT63_05120 [Thermoplasmata archaeon]